MKLLLSFFSITLLLAQSLCATPSGYEYTLDSFFGQTPTHYAVVRYTITNKGSYFTTNEKAELIEFSKLTQKVTHSTFLYTATHSLNLDDSSHRKREVNSEGKANVASKMAEYKSLNLAEIVTVKGQLTISNDTLKFNRTITLLQGKKLSKSFYYKKPKEELKPIDMSHLHLFHLNDEYYIRSKPTKEQGGFYCGGTIIYLGSEISKKLRDRETK